MRTLVHPARRIEHHRSASFGRRDHVRGGDDHDFRRFAELLEHLGLGQALEALCRRADASPDEAVRAVAADFGRRIRTDPELEQRRDPSDF